jgi:hypothetical protein
VSTTAAGTADTVTRHARREARTVASVALSRSSIQADEDTLYAACTVAAMCGGVCRGVTCLDHRRRNLGRRTAALGGSR